MASINKYQTKKGTFYRVQYRSPDGKRRTKRGFRLKGEAEKWLTNNQQKINTGEWINPSLAKKTVSEYHNHWLSTQETLKLSTQSTNRGYWVNRVEPQWGGRQVSTIRPLEIEQWVHGLPMSASSARDCHSILAQHLDIAKRDGAIKDNPARGVTLPKRKVQPIDVFLTFSQLETLANTSRFPDFVLLLGTSGLRWGEAAALRPVDLDPLNNRIHVKRSVTRVDGCNVVSSTKTHTARTVAVAEFVMAMLVERSKSVAPNGFLWTNRNGDPITTHGAKSWYRGALDKVMREDKDFPYVSGRDLRHTAASLLVQAGANVKVVQRQLGHASAKMTLDTYSTLFEDDLDNVAKVLNLFERKKSTDVKFTSEGGQMVR